MDDFTSAPPPAKAPRRLWLPGSRMLLAIALLVATVQATHLFTLRAARSRAREALMLALQRPELSAADRTHLADAFDRGTDDIYFAACGPYLLLAVAFPFLLTHLTRLSSRLLDAERALSLLLKADGSRGRWRN